MGRVWMQAAKATLDQMVCEHDSLKWSQWTVKTVKAAIRRKNNTALKKTGPLVNEAHRFCTFEEGRRHDAGHGYPDFCSRSFRKRASQTPKRRESPCFQNSIS